MSSYHEERKREMLKEIIMHHADADNRVSREDVLAIVERYGSVLDEAFRSSISRAVFRFMVVAALVGVIAFYVGRGSV